MKCLRCPKGGQCAECARLERAAIQRDVDASGDRRFSSARRVRVDVVERDQPPSPSPRSSALAPNHTRTWALSDGLTSDACTACGTVVPDGEPVALLTTHRRVRCCACMREVPTAEQLDALRRERDTPRAGFLKAGTHDASLGFLPLREINPPLPRQRPTAIKPFNTLPAKVRQQHARMSGNT